MTTESNALGSMDTTTAILQAELPLLEEHQQDLGRKLAAVTGRLESVRAALGALRVLSAAPPVALGGEFAGGLVPSARTESETRRKFRPSTNRRNTVTAKAPTERKAAPAVRKSAAKPAKSAAAKTAAATTPVARTTTAKPSAGGTRTAPTGDSSNLTAQVIEVVTASGSTPVRARDVAEALGRELTTSSINTVRSTLDRLVATSRAHRAGRGLYRAPLG